MVCGSVKEVNHMKWLSWFIFGAILWFASPFLVPLGIMYLIVRVLNVTVIGKKIEEVHNDY